MEGDSSDHMSLFLSKEPEGELPLTQPLLRTEKETEFLGVEEFGWDLIYSLLGDSTWVSPG